MGIGTAAPCDRTGSGEEHRTAAATAVLQRRLDGAL
jgi:hypothetical protein